MGYRFFTVKDKEGHRAKQRGVGRDKGRGGDKWIDTEIAFR